MIWKLFLLKIITRFTDLLYLYFAKWGFCDNQNQKRPYNIYSVFSVATIEMIFSNYYIYIEIIRIHNITFVIRDLV